MGSPDMPGGPPPDVEQQIVPDVKTAMKDTMDRLESKNQEFGGQLFATFTTFEGNPTPIEAIQVFPTPVRINAESVEGRRDNFLVVTPDGFMNIQVIPDSKTVKSGNSIGGLLTDIITSKMNGGRFFYGGIGQDGIDIGGGFYFKNDGTVQIHGEEGNVNSVRLTQDINPDEVSEIVKANLDRVQQAEALKREAEEKTRVHITAAQKVNELLG